MTDARWLRLQEMKPVLLGELRASGVVRVDYVAAYPAQDGAWVWLGTETDRQRDALEPDLPGLLVRTRRIADRCGLDPGEVRGVTVQSEETVRRTYDGSWFAALR